MVLYKLSGAIVNLYLNARYFVDIEGLENIPKTGAGIVVSNHRATNDIFLLGGFVPRHLHFIAKEELFTGEGLRGKIASLYMNDMRAIPVNRNGNESGVLKKCLSYLNKGELLAIFPEGTRYQDEHVHSFKPLASLLAQKKNVPIIPLGIHGSEQKRLWTDISMVVGEALWPQEGESREELTYRSELAVSELSGYKAPRKD
ncbi:1-acyl-sn-glycerol-3-phosphate acyltransferase [Candidatus Woesearchaeota archaeon]|nr:1-acyl-sn-glycerol-3-phosphate acyltransferase [Candidatus Woesearchaeota archaeon]